MAIKKFNEEYSNKSDVKGGSYGSVNDTKKILDQTSGDYEEKWHEAVKYLNDKLDEIVDETNKGTVASGSYASNIKTLTSAVSTNTSKTGITSTQAGHITTNNSKTGITSGQANAITANTKKSGITSTQASAITANSTIENKTEGTISFGAPDRRTGAMTITVKVGENKFTYTIAAN